MNALKKIVDRVSLKSETVVRGGFVVVGAIIGVIATAYLMNQNNDESLEDMEDEDEVIDAAE